ncbi:MAG: insulinase family protein, partial [Spirochaetes bacterium]|nr:insulinase family protein [Spirochaetota bacterium]
KGLFVIEANVNPAVSTEEVKDDILEIIRKIKQTLTVKELEKIKMIALKDHYKSRETINSRASDLGINWAIADNIKFSEYYVDGLRKVSRKDLVKVAEKYFSRNNLTYIELLPGIEEKGSQINESKQEESVTKTESLKNGLAMILHRDNSLPFISISLVFKGGVLFEPATKKGLTYFMSRLLLSGTKKYSRKRLISTIEDKGGDITSFAGNNSFGIRIEVFKSDAEEALKILKDLVLNCTFPLKEVNRIRGEILQEIRSTDERIFDTGKKLLLQEMYGKYDYSYANTGETNTIKMISSTDIRDHYKKLVQSGNCILSVAGDIRIKDIKEMAESVFKQWKKGQVHLSETAFDLPVEIKKEVKKSVDKKQSLLFLSYYGISVRDQDRIKAELLWNILNGQGSRLFTNLREKKELAYYTGMFPFYGLTTGLFVFYVGTVRDKLELSRKGLFEEINDLIKKGVTEKELQSAKKEFLMDKYRSFQSPNSISFEYALEQLYNGRVLSMHDYKEMIDSIDLITMNRFVRARLADKPYKMIILEGE